MLKLNEQSKVIIIGAGLGGLNLAQILRNNNIAFEIFERDEAPHGRKQGWAVALSKVIPDLEELLPKDIGDLDTASVNHAIQEIDSLAILNASTGEQIYKLGGVPKGQPGYSLRVSREGFRDFLWTNLPVSTNEKFSHYTEDEDGVTAFFSDGKSTHGTIIVGADGANSHVRTQLLGDDAHPELSKFIPIIGECELPPEIYEPIRKIGSAGIVAGCHNLRYLIGQRSITADRSSASYYWAVCFASEDPEAESAWVHNASKEELYAKCLEKTKDLPSFLTDIIKFSDSECIPTPPIKFVEFVTPQSLPAGSKATLLGDAAHAMVPFRAGGANTALKDGCDLARLLIKGIQTNQSVDEVLQAYHRTMLPRGRDMVLGSRAAGEVMSGLMGVTQPQPN